MKSIIVSTFIFFSAGFQLTQAQNVIVVPRGDQLYSNDTTTIFHFVESMPVFTYKNCDSPRDCWIKYLSDIAKFPCVECSDKLLLRFVVEPDSIISNASLIYKSPACHGCDRDVEKIIAYMPKWIPGKHKGNSVRVAMTMQIIFYPNH
jgi:protein TonB